MAEISISELPLEIRTKLAELELELSEGDITEKGYNKKKAKLLEPFLKLKSYIRESPQNLSAQYSSGQYQQTDSQVVHCIADNIPESSPVPPQPQARKRENRRYTRDEPRYRSDIREEAVRKALSHSRAHRHESVLIPNKRNRDSASNSQERFLQERQQLMEQDSESEDDVESRSDTSSRHPAQADVVRLSQCTEGSPILPAKSSDGAPSNNSLRLQLHHQQILNNQPRDTSTPPPDPQPPISAHRKTSRESSRYESDEIIPHQPDPRQDLEDLKKITKNFKGNSAPTNQNSPSINPWTNRHSAILSGHGSNHHSPNHHHSPKLNADSRNAASGAYGAPPDVTHHTNALHHADILISTGGRSSPILGSGDNQSAPQLASSCSHQTRDPDLSSVSLSESNGSLRSRSDSTEDASAIVATRVSEKILQLVRTLKRPKRRPLPEFFLDEDDDNIQQPVPDPSAPQPKGELIRPARGEDQSIPSGLPINMEAALQRYASVSPKANVITCLDGAGKPSVTITYAKLHQRALRIAYLLLNKLGHRGDQSLKPRDRVALVYPNNDPVGFIASFYGCVYAGVVPLPIEVPLMRRDMWCQSMGFLLSSHDVRVALTNESCFKALPRNQNAEVAGFPGWPKVQWINVDHHANNKPPRDWQIPDRLPDTEALYIEYTYGKEGSVRGVVISRRACVSHCRSLTTACAYSEADTIVCVLDFRRETGLWHSILTSVFNGMHVIYIPYTNMKMDPGCWLRFLSKFKATSAIVKSRDMHWAMLAEKEQPSLNLTTLKMLLVADGANPWSLTSCDSFLTKFRSRGLQPEAICPCASSSETLTLSLRRPVNMESATSSPRGPPRHAGGAGGLGGSAGRGVVSMQSLSHGVVRVDSENSLTSLTLQDCGQVLPGGTVVVVKPEGLPYLCKTDEVGEICLMSSFTGSGYWGLQGQSNSYFRVQPLLQDGSYLSSNQYYTRSGLLGFLGPVSSGGLIFICGSIEGMMCVSGRRHNSDDLIATILAVEPMKIVYRGRIAVFSVKILKDERIVMAAELRVGYNEEACFKWMSRVLQAVDSIHQVNIYCVALVPQNCLPKTPLGGIHTHETKRRFQEGSLHPCNVLLCPHTAITNLPQPREVRVGDVGPSAMMVGKLVQGARLASARGIDMPLDDSEKRPQFLTEILQWRASHTPESKLFSVINSKMQECANISCLQLHRRAEKIGNMILEKGKVAPGAHIALIFSPGIDLVCAVFGCLYAGCVPVPLKPPSVESLETSLDAALMIVQSSRAAVLLAHPSIIKIIRSKDAVTRIPIAKWPTLVTMEENYRKKLTSIYKPMSAEQELAYLDFAVSTTGVLTGIRMSHASTNSLCHSLKIQCELYSSREVVLCLEPYSGLGFVLWCLSSVYCGHQTVLVPPQEMDNAPWLWLTVCSNRKVRDTFCSYAAVELSTKALPNEISSMKNKGVSLSCLRSLVIVAEERPRVQLTSNFTKLFSVVSLNPRCVSASFGCRVNVALCLQGASSPDTSNAYVDTVSLRNDRVKILEKGSPKSICLIESGKLLPGVEVVIANPETLGQCADSQMGEVWVASNHNSAGYFIVYGGEERNNYNEMHFSAKLATGNSDRIFARTGYLGFVRRTDLTRSDGDLHDALFIVGALDEAITLRGMRYHPVDIETTILRAHRKVSECAVFTWSNLLVAVVELDAHELEAMDLIHPVTTSVLEEHLLVLGVVVIVDLGTIVINSRGMKQRMLLRDTFVNDRLDPIYVSYNM